MTSFSSIPRVSYVDYFIHQGQIKAVKRNPLTDEYYFENIDEIPEKYWERWEVEDTEVKHD